MKITKKDARIVPWIVVMAALYFMGVNRWQLSYASVVILATLALAFLLLFGFWLLRDKNGLKD